MKRFFKVLFWTLVCTATKHDYEFQSVVGAGEQQWLKYYCPKCESKMWISI